MQHSRISFMLCYQIRGPNSPLDSAFDSVPEEWERGDHHPWHPPQCLLASTKLWMFKSNPRPTLLESYSTLPLAYSSMATQANLRDKILNRPALAAPIGIVPDFAARSPYWTQMLSLTLSMFLLSTLAVVIRMYTKIFVAKRLAFEDCELRPTTTFCNHAHLQE